MKSKLHHSGREGILSVKQHRYYPPEDHRLDIHPVPEDQTPLYINEPWLTDPSYEWLKTRGNEPENENDNIRVYIPMDLNSAAILRRLRFIINQYGEANEENESAFDSDVRRILSQIEIYDQVWFAREGNYPTDNQNKITGHSKKAKALVAQVVKELESIPDGCAELFPFELIEELKDEYHL